MKGPCIRMLAACVASGWPIQTYLEPSHPLQQLVMRTVEELSGESVAHTAIDGCGAPVYGLSWPYDHPDYARPGEMTGDSTAILPSVSFTTQTYFSRAPVNAVTGYVRFQVAHSNTPSRPNIHAG